MAQVAPDVGRDAVSELGAAEQLAGQTAQPERPGLELAVIRMAVLSRDQDRRKRTAGQTGGELLLLDGPLDLERQVIGVDWALDLLDRPRRSRVGRRSIQLWQRDVGLF